MEMCLKGNELVSVCTLVPNDESRRSFKHQLCQLKTLAPHVVGGLTPSVGRVAFTSISQAGIQLVHAFVRDKETYKPLRARS
jgi:hypothetical protein